MQTLAEVHREVQALPVEIKIPDSGLSPHDRRALLSAALRLFLHRIRHNLPVHKSELLHLVECGDDDLEVAA
jgi:hypothetical protein